MSFHIDAKPGEIADTVLLPGDPLRAKHIAEHLLDDAVCYNQVRGMLGYTGFYQGQRVSLQSTGMGMPSAAIYITEMIQAFGIKQMIRIGTTGALPEHINVGDIILPLAAATDSNIPNLLFADHYPALCPDAELLQKMLAAAQAQKIAYHMGPVFTTDRFYAEPHVGRDSLQKTGTLSVDMETAMVFLLGMQHQVKALSVLTVSDHINKGEAADALTREQKFMTMVKLALETAIS